MTQSVWRISQFRNSQRQTLFLRTAVHADHSGLLLMLHGMGEHSGRYEKFRQELEDLNLDLAVFDFRGHGQSEGRRVYVDSFSDYLDDINCCLEYIQKEIKAHSKIYLLGHSMGGLAAVTWALKNQGRLKGLFLSSPCLGIPMRSWVEKFNRGVRKLFPAFVYSNPVLPATLTHDEQEAKLYASDPMIQRKISARLLDEMVLYCREIWRSAPHTFKIPVHGIIAGDERIVDNVATKRFFKEIISPQKSLVELPGFYHEVFNEIDSRKAFAALKSAVSQALQIS